ncbi:MAG: phosphatidate cytidylyltransferase, partial [Verrucomicrobiae bacterium]|nr:phosphatidate cytidylyltransferase [Verrucomicrobiae bacterium]
NGDGPGWLFIFYLVVVTKFCDIGAYLTGRLFGRHPLAPSISPKKTWEGLLGGFVVAFAASVSAYEYLKPRVSAVGFGYADAVLLGILLGGMGVIGDLAESVIKRQANAKDSGGVLPGIGGALDLIDSLLFTVPVLYAWLVLKMELGG